MNFSDKHIEFIALFIKEYSYNIRKNIHLSSLFLNILFLCICLEMIKKIRIDHIGIFGATVPAGMLMLFHNLLRYQSSSSSPISLPSSSFSLVVPGRRLRTSKKPLMSRVLPKLFKPSQALISREKN